MLKNKNKFILILLIILLITNSLQATANILEKSEFDFKYEQWLKEAELGAYQTESEDWDLILAKAKTEPPMTIYSGTSRIIDVVEELNDSYNLKIAVLNSRAIQLINRISREFDSGHYNVDLVISGGADYLYSELLTKKAITRYVPKEIEKVVQPSFSEPLLVHRFSVGTWYYNNKSGTEIPYQNIWELTTEKWNGKIVMQSPLKSGTTMDYMIAIAYNDDKIERLYQEYFNEKIELSTENAGFELIKRLLENDVEIVDDFREVGELVSNAENDFLGLGTQSLYRGVIDGSYNFSLDTKVNPAVLSPRVIAIGSFTQSPNKAKFVINHLISQTGGSPWWGIDFPANPLVKTDEKISALNLSNFSILWSTPLDQQIFLREKIKELFQDIV